MHEACRSASTTFPDRVKLALFGKSEKQGLLAYASDSDWAMVACHPIRQQISTVCKTLHTARDAMFDGGIAFPSQRKYLSLMEEAMFRQNKPSSPSVKEPGFRRDRAQDFNCY